MPSLKINGRTVEVDAEPDTPLLWVLRDDLGLTGTKFGCGIAQCGACTVHVDGQPTRSCQLPLGRRGAARSRPSRACRARRRGGAGRLEQARRAAVRLLPVGPDHVGGRAAGGKPKPTDADIDDGMSGNICRCGTYQRIRAADHARGRAGEGLSMLPIERLAGPERAPAATSRRRFLVGAAVAGAGAQHRLRPAARRPRPPRARRAAATNVVTPFERASSASRPTTPSP